MIELPYSAVSAWPLLALLQLLPLLGAVVVFRMGERFLAVLTGRVVALAELGLAVAVVLRVDWNNTLPQLAERVPFLYYHAAADGISALFVLLGALITVLLTLYGLVRGLPRGGRLMGLFLVAECAMMTQLTTFNLIWFAVSSLVELSVAGILVGQWSTASPEHRTLATSRFYQFQGMGFLMLLGGIVIVGWDYADVMGRWSFDYFDLIQSPLRPRFQAAAFFLLFYGLAARTPLFPMHGWLPTVMHWGTVSVAPALLLGVKVGIYGMIRFVLPLMPDAVVQWKAYVVAFAMVGVFYAAALALMQATLRRLMAFAIVSHTGLIVAGLFSLHASGIAGAVLLAANFGLAATTMLFMVGLVFRRTRTTRLNRLGGLFERIPFIAVCFLIGGLAIAGMPGTPGFDAAHLVLEAAMGSFGALPTIATALGNVAAASFLLWAFQKAFVAPRPPEEIAEGRLERTLPMEYLVGGVAVAALLSVGWYFETWLSLVEPVAKAMALRFGAGHV